MFRNLLIGDLTDLNGFLNVTFVDSFSFLCSDFRMFRINALLKKVATREVFVK